VDEFRDMVKALHRVGIEVFLDVAFSHTAEGDPAGAAAALLRRAKEGGSYHVTLSLTRSRCGIKT
jgi:pullulanase/glycogen debranching enzyme